MAGITDITRKLTLSHDIAYCAGGYQVIAAIRVPDPEGNNPERHVVIVHDHPDRPDGFSTYLAFRIQDIMQWKLEYPVSGLRLSRAFRDMAERADGCYLAGLNALANRDSLAGQ